MAKAAKRPLAVFNIKKYLQIGAFLLKVIGIVQNIKNNAGMYATPKPPILTVEGHLDELKDAEIAVQTRAPGSAQARDEKYDQVLDDVHTLQNYVQDLADEAVDTQAAITVITTSGFDLKVNGVRVKPVLSAKNTVLPGVAKLIAKAAGQRAIYNWQQSADNGTTWVDLPDTLKANTTVSGLTPASRVLFRVQAVTKDGPLGWCQPVSLIVL